MKKDDLQVMDLHTVVVGSGAAGLNTADRLWQYGVHDLALVTENMDFGTSRNTGSDKQTYYKLSLAGDPPDSISRLAQVLYEGGCVDGEHALCEASLSCQGFFKLVELGVPFPHDSHGQFVGYKTDHDPNDRGTSVGPYTSRYMTEALERAVRNKEVPVYDKHQVIRILTKDHKVYGLLCLKTGEGSPVPGQDDAALSKYVLIRCTNVVYATGGPAGIYADSVYPASQTGASGIAFESGVRGKNLTEWQYGLASLSPRWNVSGSYMQALPRMVSTDKRGGDDREFLMEFYNTREAALDKVFLKGYQWPFDARKVTDGSSMIDLLVYRETCVRGRRVWLDYRTNPGGSEIAFEALSQETRDYLGRSGACGQTPYERLQCLNSPAAAFYKEHGVDLEREMLEIAVCAQHNNGGLAVDAWWQTNVEGFFCAGEAAATHGIYRPGGSALNSGQVGSTRAAQYIAAHKDSKREWTEEEHREMLSQAAGRIAMGERLAGELEFGKKWKKAAMDMSRYGAMIRDPEGMQEMEKEIHEELAALRLERRTDSGTEAGNEAETAANAVSPSISSLSAYYRYYDMRLCQSAYLAAMLDYTAHGCKSRGSAVYLEKPEKMRRGTGGRSDQVNIPELAAFSLDGSEGMDHKNVVQELSYDHNSGTCSCFWRPVRRLEEIQDREAFEVVWKNYREGKIF